MAALPNCFWCAAPRMHGLKGGIALLILWELSFGQSVVKVCDNLQIGRASLLDQLQFFG